jgi:ADP-ribose pyrophosphatase YjhB (NUDIX family)
MTHDVRVAHVRALLLAHQPVDRLEQHSVALLQRYLNWLPEPFSETADPTHVTASAVVLTPNDRVLVHRHKRLGIYLQPGGHIDGNEMPEVAAARELHEETGVHLEAVRLVHVDQHQGPRGHVHFDLRYLFCLPSGITEFTPDIGESTDVRLMPLSWVQSTADSSLRRAVVAARAFV